jgi:hypothetical protein
MPKKKKRTTKTKAEQGVVLYEEIPQEYKDPGGRPTVVTEEVMAYLRQAFLVGATDRQACAFAGISEKTLYNYQEKHPEFLQQKEEWKDTPVLKAKTTIVNNLSKVPVATWYLERKAKDEFSTRSEVTGKDGGPVETKLTNFEQLMADRLVQNGKLAKVPTKKTAPKKAKPKKKANAKQ